MSAWRSARQAVGVGKARCRRLAEAEQARTPGWRTLGHGFEVWRRCHRLAVVAARRQMWRAASGWPWLEQRFAPAVGARRDEGHRGAPASSERNAPPGPSLLFGELEQAVVARHHGLGRAEVACPG